MGSCSYKVGMEVGMEVVRGEKIWEPWGFIFFLGSMGELLI